MSVRSLFFRRPPLWSADLAERLALMRSRLAENDRIRGRHRVSQADHDMFVEEYAESRVEQAIAAGNVEAVTPGAVQELLVEGSVEFTHRRYARYEVLPLLESMAHAAGFARLVVMPGDDDGEPMPPVSLAPIGIEMLRLSETALEMIEILRLLDQTMVAQAVPALFNELKILSFIRREKRRPPLPYWAARIPETSHPNLLLWQRIAQAEGAVEAGRIMFLVRHGTSGMVDATAESYLLQSLLGLGVCDRPPAEIVVDPGYAARYLGWCRPHTISSINDRINRGDFSIHYPVPPDNGPGREMTAIPPIFDSLVSALEGADRKEDVVAVLQRLYHCLRDRPEIPDESGSRCSDRALQIAADRRFWFDMEVLKPALMVSYLAIPVDGETRTRREQLLHQMGNLISRSEQLAADPGLQRLSLLLECQLYGG